VEKLSNWLQVRYGDRKRVFSDPGSPIKDEYEPVFDKRGVWHLEKSGERNIFDEIQTHADSCDINIIMARYRNGETDVLTRVQGVYADVTQIPTDYAGVMNMKLQAEKLFYGLSAEVREKYGNSVEQFMSALGTKEGLEDIGFKFEAAAAESPKEEGAVNES